jgi:ATP-binding cassette, subfamily B, bacterial
VLWYGAPLALTGQLSAVLLIVFLLYLGKMYKPMRKLSKMTDTVSKAAVGYDALKLASIKHSSSETDRQRWVQVLAESSWCCN